MANVLLVRPNDFIADAMSKLLVRAGLEALRVRNPAELEQVQFGGVVGAVISTAVTSAMPMSFSEAVTALRRRSSVPLVATTLLKDAPRATAFVVAELSGLTGFVPFSGQSPHLGTPDGILVLRKSEIEAPDTQTVELLSRHFRRG